MTKIGDYAFKDCSSLTEIKLPDSLTSIDYWAFKDCSSLTEINFPDSLTSIYGWAFKGCSSLTEINFPDSLTYIGDRAFYGCTSLTEINFPDSLTSIDSYAFAYCSSLKKITYHKKTEELLKDYFGDKWNSFEKVLIAEDLPKVPSNEKKFAATFKEIEELFAKAKTCDPDALVQLKNFIKRAQDLIASLYYDGNKKNAVGSIILSEDITSIDACEFKDCDKLEKIILPEGLTSIGKEAFKDCYNLEEIFFGKNLTSIEEYAFVYCDGLKKITYHKKIEDLLKKSFGKKQWASLKRNVI